MTRIFYLYPGPDGFVRGWGQADGETDADIAAILSVPGRVHVDAAIIAQYKAGGTWGWDGAALVAMALPVDIERERAASLWQADQTAEAARRSFLSAGAGQALEYVLTLLEAQQALAAATTVAGEFPLLAAELRAQTEAGGNPTLLDIARQIDAVDKSTRIALAAIKLRRRRAKIVIRAAADVGAMQSALTGAAQTA